MSWDKAIPYFSEKELACKSSGIVKLDRRFAAMLPALRVAWGKSLTLSSVCRTPEHNQKVGGHPRSLHLTENSAHDTEGTMAADIAWRHWSRLEQLKFARLAYKMNWAVGLHDGFIHVDRRHDLGVQKTVFLYGTWNGFSRKEVF